MAHDGKYDTKYVTFEYLLHAAFVGEIFFRRLTWTNSYIFPWLDVYRTDPAQRLTMAG